MIGLKKTHLVIRSLLLMVVLTMVAACAGPEKPKEMPKITFDGRKILVLPIRDMARLYGVNKSVISPISGKYFITGEVMEESAAFLTDELVAFVKGRPEYLCFPPSQAEGQIAGLLTGDRKRNWDRQFFADVGRRLRSDAVLSGNVYRFQERVGRPQSVESPASVEFELHLIRTADGAVVWSGYYGETQRSLSENLLDIKTFIKRKGRWITAEEMAVSGLSEVLRTFPDYADYTGD